jgi:hypothetical protein
MHIWIRPQQNIIRRNKFTYGKSLQSKLLPQLSTTPWRCVEEWDIRIVPGILNDTTWWRWAVNLIILILQEFSIKCFPCRTSKQKDWGVARRRISKDVPTNPHPTIEGHSLVSNRPVNVHHSNDCATIDCFLWRPLRGVILKTIDATGVSWGFTCGVLTSGQRKQNNLPC